MAILSVPTWVVWCAWAVLGAIKTRDAAGAVGLLINASILLLLGPVRKLYLLNKYQALMEEEEKNSLQEERANKGATSSLLFSLSVSLGFLSALLSLCVSGIPLCSWSVCVCGIPQCSCVCVCL